MGLFAREAKSDRRCDVRHGNTKHGLRGNPSYHVWYGMMNRCHNNRSAMWSTYGGRGIVVCERWHSLKNFIEDMGNKPKGKSLDRVDNNKGYHKENCRWATPEEQSNNLRVNRKIEYRGEVLGLSQWARKLGMSHHTLWARLNLGWSVEKAFNTPVNKNISEARKKREVFSIKSWAQVLD